MQTCQLGNSDLHITPIGLGTWAIGGGGWYGGWGAQDDNDNTDCNDLYQIHMPAETDEETAEG